MKARSKVRLAPRCIFSSFTSSPLIFALEDVVLTLLSLTNLDSVLDVHSSLDAALESFREEQVCTDC